MALPDHQLELLAPARDADIGIAAIHHGADAVYIGGPGFGARANAGNPIGDIARLCEEAHRFHAKIFITLNTILRDDELEGARRMAWDVYNAGADVLIVQDMGLLELDLPPIELHASTQTDIRTPEKARFLQDAGFSQLVLARELTLPQIAAIREVIDPSRCALEFFIHGALCVAYSGQCFISHAHTGRSANRGNCSQECRLPYTVTDSAGRIVAHEQHVLSLKDNDQSANLGALVDAGIRSFKIEGRYKDLGYVKNVTGHYRQLIDELLEQRAGLSRASSGRTRLLFTPDPQRNFNRGATDYFVTGRKDDIGAFDTPKHAGLPLGHVTQVAAEHFEIELDDSDDELSNGDGLTYFDLQRELIGLQANRAQRDGHVWRVYPREAMASLKDLRRGTAVHRNRDMAWDRLMAGHTSERRIGVWMRLHADDSGFVLSVHDEDGCAAQARIAHAHEPAKDAARSREAAREQLGRLGQTEFQAIDITLDADHGWFIPNSLLNTTRRDAIAALQAERSRSRLRPQRGVPSSPPAPYPDDTLSYLGNVFNHKARDFYARHGVQVIESAYESQETTGEASLMITKHCVRFSLSLCPKQAKGVTGVQGTIRAEPLTLIHGNDRLTLRFDCKPCEMHVVGSMRRNVLAERARELRASQAAGEPIRFYKTRPAR